ncbi:hypothetical protein DDV21_010910 [Streptococcus chenjunshii]|uniref:Uncharacterized protein n=1 Tax=Streptococcus chenjunshii TaxID=2173853 RepID=A0A372KIZ5_9STRE|nr:hypothetical protein [Streptococcus chenjunshii]AXQ79534.1 hypothetical protein DDV21_010910 [Streptococcus chenjunshii]RFU50110.1 hypothetical protein DDV22_10415 [Streptococcus chenjunshii]RFU52262.1 hypothetical protein DDV23_10640 [Streptococcus chenjunshii]
MLFDKTKVPLIKEDSYFIYGDSVTGQLYKVFETKTVSANQNRLLLLYIAGAAVIKQADRLYLPFSTPFFNTALLVLFMFLIVLMSQKQLKR